MGRAQITILSNQSRQKALRWVRGAPAGTRIEFRGPKRSLPQNDIMWGHLTDIQQQFRRWDGQSMSTNDWKLMFLDALDREKRIVSSLDGARKVNLGNSSSSLSKEEMSDLITLIIAFADRNGIELKGSPMPEGFEQ